MTNRLMDTKKQHFMHLYIGKWQVAGEQLSALSVIANHGPGWAFSVQYTHPKFKSIV